MLSLLAHHNIVRGVTKQHVTLSLSLSVTVSSTLIQSRKVTDDIYCSLRALSLSLDNVVSVSNGKEPYFLPVLFLDDKHLHWSCHPGTPCKCVDDFCNSS